MKWIMLLAMFAGMQDKPAVNITCVKDCLPRVISSIALPPPKAYFDYLPDKGGYYEYNIHLLNEARWTWHCDLTAMTPDPPLGILQNRDIQTATFVCMRSMTEVAK